VGLGQVPPEEDLATLLTSTATQIQVFILGSGGEGGLLFPWTTPRYRGPSLRCVLGRGNKRIGSFLSNCTLSMMNSIVVVLLMLHSAVSIPVLTYFEIAGRGELARLYCVVGGLEFVDSTVSDDYKTETPIGYLPAVSDPDSGLFPNCTFDYGCLQESLAVERYFSNLAPGFSSLTLQVCDVNFSIIVFDCHYFSLLLLFPGACCR
jgi:hypothetical protein